MTYLTFESKKWQKHQANSGDLDPKAYHAKTVDAHVTQIIGKINKEISLYSEGDVVQFLSDCGNSFEAIVVSSKGGPFNQGRFIKNGVANFKLDVSVPQDIDYSFKYSLKILSTSEFATEPFLINVFVNVKISTTFVPSSINKDAFFSWEVDVFKGCCYDHPKKIDLPGMPQKIMLKTRPVTFYHAADIQILHNSSKQATSGSYMPESEVFSED